MQVMFARWTTWKCGFRAHGVDRRDDLEQGGTQLEPGKVTDLAVTEDNIGGFSVTRAASSDALPGQSVARLAGARHLRPRAPGCGRAPRVSNS